MDTGRQTTLLQRIFRIVPEFEQEWAEDNSEPEFRTFTLHSVYMSFLPYVAKLDLTEKQFRMLADLLNDEVSKGGDSENAVDTCFLEHAHQVGISGKLKPWLSEKAKAMPYS